MRRIVIIGAGIVGVSAARTLASRSGIEVTVIERDGGAPRGSTAFAPGFIGLYNDAPILLDLAKASASIYRDQGVGFLQAGGLELASTTAGAEEIERRSQAARAAGLHSVMLADHKIPESVAAFIDNDAIVAAAFCSDDAVGEPAVLCAALRARAVADGVTFVRGEAIAIESSGGGPTVVTGSGDRFAGDDVVLAGGVWGASLTEMVGVTLPIVPVSHPYVYSAAQMRFRTGPFVRWPEHHVYARVQGDRLGIGSYDHRPVPVGYDELADGAGLVWNSAFDPVIAAAQQFLRQQTRFEADRRINGVFAMTPDNLPFLGRHPTMPDIWIAQAIWVTHGAGAAERLADAMTTGSPLPNELRVDRFAGKPSGILQSAALRLYRDIYANDRPA